VAQRYARTLRIDMKALHGALQEARNVLRKGGKVAGGRSELEGEGPQAEVEELAGQAAPTA